MFATILVFWGMQTFMTQIETWYFREAMPQVDNAELVNLFIRPLITALTFIPIATWILKKGEPKENPLQLNLLSKWKTIGLLSVMYVIIYFVFGYYIAWQFEEVRVFYSGTPVKPGFIDQLLQTIDQKNLIIPFQLLRGLLWVGVGLPLLYLKGSNAEKITASVLLYALPSIQLIIENPFMPEGVRIAHLLEVSSSNALFGLLIGFGFCFEFFAKQTNSFQTRDLA